MGNDSKCIAFLPGLVPVLPPHPIHPRKKKQREDKKRKGDLDSGSHLWLIPGSCRVPALVVHMFFFSPIGSWPSPRHDSRWRFMTRGSGSMTLSQSMWTKPSTRFLLFQPEPLPNASLSFCFLSCWQISLHESRISARCQSTNAFLALFHHSYDYPVKTEGDSIDQFGSYAGNLPFVGDSHVRPDGYGLLDQQMLHSMPLSTAKALRYAPQPANLESPSYVLPFFPCSFCHWSIGPAAISFEFHLPPV